ncbi:MAG: helix-turn-helix domain-containing protein [Candidatus Korarchaeum sp.]|nr:helix-turn-helix domain-containing protein [Candidatus Korarchaeum sp.]
MIRMRFNEHLNYLNKIYPYEDSPFYKLSDSYRKVTEVVKEIPRLLSDSLSELFISHKQEILNHFSEDVKFLIESGNIRELDDEEINAIVGFVGDLLDSIYSKVVRRISNDLHRYLRWAPEAGDTNEDLIRRCEEHYKELIGEIAKAKAERDLYRERAESLESSSEVIVTGKYKILELLERSGRSLKPVEIASELNLSEVTVRKYIRELLIEGLLAKNDKVRPYTYSLGDLNWRTRLKARK